MRIKFLLTVVALTAAVFAYADFKNPDFAFPQEVNKDARHMLATSDDGPTRFKAVMEIVKATTDINPDSLRYMPAFIDDIAKQETRPDLKALYALYEAQIIADCQPSKSETIDSLLVVASSDIRKWGMEPTEKYNLILDISTVGRDFFAHIYDFVIFKLINLNPQKTDDYISWAIDMSATGSPEWAYWICCRQSNENQLTDALKQTRSNNAKAYLILHICRNSQIAKSEKIKLIHDFLANRTQCELTQTLQSELERLTAPKFEIIAPEAVAPGQSFKVTAIYSFASEVGLELYQLTDIHKFNAGKSKISNYSRPANPEAINDTVYFTLAIDRPGNYELTIDSSDLDKTQYIPSARITVTDWLPIGYIYDKQAVAGVADFKTGKPVNNVIVSLLSDQKTLNASTDKDGFAYFSLQNKKNIYHGGYFTLSEGHSKVQFNDGIWTSGYKSTGLSIQGNIYTSRPLYHFGDTIGWAAVLVQKDYDRLRSDLAGNRQFSAILYDANNQPIDTIETISDNFGRISGHFVAPTDRLAGQYRITVTENRRNICHTYLTISDFKLPAVELTDLRISQNDTAYIVNGRALRFTGASVAGATIDVVIRRAPYWWAYTDNFVFEPVTSSVTTGADGTFAAYFPINRDDIPANGLNLVCDLNLTTLNAEIASAQMNFRIGKPTFIYATPPYEPVNCALPVNLSVRSVGSNLEFKPIKLNWTLNGIKSYTGTFETDSLEVAIDWSNIDAGKYRLTIAPNDTTQCNTLDLGDVWIYNSIKNLIPDDLAIVLPKASYENVSGDFVDIEFGVGADCYVYSFGISKDGKIEAKAEQYSRGFHSCRISLDRRERQEIRMAVVKDGKVYVVQANVSRPLPDTTLRLHGEVWRDKLVPGAEERWIVRLSDASGHGEVGAVIATLYNGAIDKLTNRFIWPRLEDLLKAPQQNIRQQFVFPTFTVSHISATAPRKYVGVNIPSPQFRYLPQPISYERIYYASANASTRMSRAESKTTGAVADLAEEADDASETNLEFEQDNTAYRDHETLQAFWRPLLYTDKDGYSVIEFTMPNALGKWNFKASAWTQDMRTASMAASLIASKPVMDEPSLPRFLRQGDHVYIGTTVINNSDSSACLITNIEIFNPLTNKLFKTQTYSNEIAAKGQELLYIDFDVPIDSEYVGFRVRTSNGEFTDGEQAAIPILPAATVAIDADLFYLDEKRSTFTTVIPPSENAIIAIDYVQNPVWDAIKTLPSLYQSEPLTCLSAASSAYASLTAGMLYDRFPEIKHTLEIWLENPTDSLLVSNLSKNNDLKLATLANTPFVGAANANTERMNRFALTFDKTIIHRNLQIATAKLVDLQLSNGAFSWGSWTKTPDRWLTQQVLDCLSRVADKKAIYSDSRLKTIIDKAFDYLDNTTTGVDYQYTALYSRFPDRRPSTIAGQRSIDATIQNILKNWKQHSTSHKASDAIILRWAGNVNTAKEIMRSIEQFAQDSPRVGVAFPSVTQVENYIPIIEAFAELQPNSPLIDGMRKWLIMATQTTDNFASCNPERVVAAILLTGTNWVSSATTTASVAIDGRPIKITNVEASTGAFSQRLESSSSPRAITFTCPETTSASYGSVTSIATIPLAQIKPRSIDGLKITKRYKVKRDGEWVETTDFILGDRVRVELDIEVGQPLQYVTLIDNRPAGFEPVSQMPGWIYTGQAMYRETTDTSTNIFITRLDKADYHIDYEVIAAYAGSFSTGIATIQSQLAPEFTARSGATTIMVHQ